MPSKGSYTRFVVVLKPPRSASSYISWVAMILQKTAASSWFPHPTPSLAEVKAALDTMETAQVATLSGGLAKTTTRDAARRSVHGLVERLASYVQGIADANRDQSLAIIQSAGLEAKKSSGSRAHTFEAKRRGPSGTAHLTAPGAGDRAKYFWQMSLDGGLTWIDLPSTTKSSTDVKNLARGTTVLFRYKTLTTKGESNWSDSLPYFVD